MVTANIVIRSKLLACGHSAYTGHMVSIRHGSVFCWSKIL